MSLDDDLKALQDATKALAESIEITPVIYDKDDQTGVVKPIWAGKPVTGVGASERANAITNAKMAEYAEKGASAFGDSQPLDKVLAPGESRFDNGFLDFSPTE